MPNPEPFLVHLRQEGYHPRSDKHSNALARCVVGDLTAHCPPIRRKAEAGELVYSLNFQILTGTAEWKVDLVLGQPPAGPVERPAPGEITQTVPERATFVTKPPAPRIGDPLHYDAFIQAICNRYTERYG